MEPSENIPCVVTKPNYDIRIFQLLWGLEEPMNIIGYPLSKYFMSSSISDAYKSKAEVDGIKITKSYFGCLYSNNDLFSFMTS